MVGICGEIDSVWKELHSESAEFRDPASGVLLRRWTDWDRNASTRRPPDE